MGSAGKVHSEDRHSVSPKAEEVDSYKLGNHV